MIKDKHKIGIWFWSGAGIYSLINLLLNYRHVAQDKILNYNYIIFFVALAGLILNIIMNKMKGAKSR